MHPILFEIGPLPFYAFGIAAALIFYGMQWYSGKVESWVYMACAALVGGGFYLSRVYPPTTLPLHVYGLMIAIAFLVGMQLAARDARRVDLSKNRDFDKFVLDLCFGILLVSMVGSRIMFIIVNFEEYAKDPAKIFRIWEGGLVFYGGLIGALLYSVYYSIKHGHDFFQVADTLIPYVSLGAMFGRLGCFAAGCCWGQTVDDGFPLAVQFPQGSLIYSSMVSHGLIPPTAGWTLHVHPVQLYDSFGELGIFMLLSFIRTRKRFHGHVFLVFMFLYPVWRSLVETLRGDKERGLYDILGFVKLSTSQIISILIATIAVTILFALRRRMTTVSTPAPAPTSG